MGEPSKYYSLLFFIIFFFNLMMPSFLRWGLGLRDV